MTTNKHGIAILDQDDFESWAKAMTAEQPEPKRKPKRTKYRTVMDDIGKFRVPIEHARKPL